MIWEYKTLSYKESGSFGTTSTVEQVDAQMAQLGKAGWELTATLTPAGGAGANLLIFKRPKAE